MESRQGVTRATSTIEQADIAAVEKLRPVLESAPAQAIGKVGKLADEPPLAILSAAVLAGGLVTGHRNLRRAGLRMLAAHAIAVTCKNLGKNSVDRTRPNLLEGGEYRMEPGGSKDKNLRSFPSGHAAGITAVTRAASRELGLGPLPAVTAVAMAGLQVVRRAHFPSDVLAGLAIGYVSEAIASALLRPVLGRSGMTDRRD